jgi:hypothetical protein
MSTPPAEDLFGRWAREDAQRKAMLVESRKHMTQRLRINGQWQTVCPCGWQSEPVEHYSLLGFECAAFRALTAAE